MMDRWYDGCMGWASTPTRIQIFSFGLPYLTPPTSYFYTVKGQTGRFDPMDITGKKVGTTPLSSDCYTMNKPYTFISITA